MTDLSDRDVEMLAMENLRWDSRGAKEQMARRTFGLSMVAYHAALNQLIDRQEAMAHDPLLVKRLRKVRADRTRRSAPRRAPD